MKKLLTIFAAALVFIGCQNRDIDIEPAKLAAPDVNTIQGQLVGDDYVITWPQLAEGLQMQVTLVQNGSKQGTDLYTDCYVHATVETGIQYQYVFKLFDGENYSVGVIKEYTRLGASKCTGLSMAQVDKAGGYDAHVEWEVPANATIINFHAVAGNREITEQLPATTTEYIIADVVVGEEWEVTLVAENADGKSLPTTAKLKIGKTAVAFLASYTSVAALIADGDDDEAAFWLWFEKEYPTGQFLSTADIKSAADLEPFRVIVYYRDLEGVGEDVVLHPENDPGMATALPLLTEWYKAGGSMLLWSHAMPLIAALGRIPAEAIANNDKAIGAGVGGINNDVWKIAIQLNPGGKFVVDNSTHPLFKGIEYETTDRTKLVAMKGAGWTEDHNCLFFNYPSQLTGLGNQDRACYDVLVSKYGIRPLATWDGQIDWISQLNIWEAFPASDEATQLYQGTILCIGNGGCEFSMKNIDGTPDKSALPTNNSCQANVIKLAKNAIEYLKTR